MIRVTCFGEVEHFCGVTVITATQRRRANYRDRKQYTHVVGRIMAVIIAATERVLEDGLWFIVVAVVLAFFWFHRRAGVRPNRPAKEKSHTHAKADSAKIRNTA